MANLAAQFGAQVNAGNKFLEELKARREGKKPVEQGAAPQARGYPVANYHPPSGTKELFATTSDPILAAHWRAQHAKANPTSWTVSGRGTVTSRRGGRRSRVRNRKTKSRNRKTRYQQRGGGFNITEETMKAYRTYAANILDYRPINITAFKTLLKNIYVWRQFGDGDKLWMSTSNADDPPEKKEANGIRRKGYISDIILRDRLTGNAFTEENYRHLNSELRGTAAIYYAPLLEEIYNQVKGIPEKLTRDQTFSKLANEYKQKYLDDIVLDIMYAEIAKDILRDRTNAASFFETDKQALMMELNDTDKDTLAKFLDGTYSKPELWMVPTLEVIKLFYGAYKNILDVPVNTIIFSVILTTIFKGEVAKHVLKKDIETKFSGLTGPNHDNLKQTILRSLLLPERRDVFNTIYNQQMAVTGKEREKTLAIAALKEKEIQRPVIEAQRNTATQQAKSAFREVSMPQTWQGSDPNEEAAAAAAQAKSGRNADFNAQLRALALSFGR
jgi:hypothetical protein